MPSTDSARTRERATNTGGEVLREVLAVDDEDDPPWSPVPVPPCS